MHGVRWAGRSTVLHPHPPPAEGCRLSRCCCAGTGTAAAGTAWAQTTPPATFLGSNEGGGTLNVSQLHAGALHASCRSSCRAPVRLCPERSSIVIVLQWSSQERAAAIVSKHQLAGTRILGSAPDIAQLRSKIADRLVVRIAEIAWEKVVGAPLRNLGGGLAPIASPVPTVSAGCEREREATLCCMHQRASTAHCNLQIRDDGAAAITLTFNASPVANRQRVVV